MDPSSERRIDCPGWMKHSHVTHRIPIAVLAVAVCSPGSCTAWTRKSLLLCMCAMGSTLQRRTEGGQGDHRLPEKFRNHDYRKSSGTRIVGVKSI